MLRHALTVPSVALVITIDEGTVISACSPWTDAATVRGGIEELVAADDSLINLAVAWASDSLFDLSGRRWPGLCEATVRPLGDHSCVGGSWLSALHRANQAISDAGSIGATALLGGGGWYGPSCRGIPEVDLGAYPLVRIVDVLLDGTSLDPAAYRIDNSRLLTRVDGKSWPCWQDVTKPTTEQGTWQVHYTYGTKPPPGGAGSAMLYARELAYALLGSSKCRLPSRTQQVSRQGVTVIAYPQSILDGQRTGLPEVDAWLASVNPQKIRAAATVVSPDYPPGVRRAGT